MNYIKHVSKIDASRRQIDTAIRLYFNDGDDIAIHTLTCASHEILKKLGKNINIESIILDQMVGNIFEHKKEAFLKIINEAKNFFKHGLQGNKEIGKTIKFSPEFTDFWIWDACLMYRQLTGESTDYMKIFIVWFYTQNNEIISDDKTKDLFKKNIEILPSSREEFFSYSMGIIGLLK